MYRYSVDNAVTYTPSDFRLFRESPFAVWMERLTLENPDHGSIPDSDSPPPTDEALPQDEIVESLRDEDRDVVLINWELDEPRRRADTLDAMRSGADFIVNGMLALGPLAGSANLLMRTSGYSDFGDFLYIPCDTQGRDTLDAAFRLCFLADLLHSLQGQLPPQMLLIREDANVEPLQTEEHIYYYRAVKKRFMTAMGDFRKHRMPDPAESVHFGRWSACAQETLRRRDVNPDYQLQELTEVADEAAEAQDASAYEIVAPVARAAGSGNRDVAAVGHSGGGSVEALHASGQGASAPTLAEQARMLSRDAFRSKAAPGQTPNLARFPRLVTTQAEAAPDNATAPAFADETLRDLAFIGSTEPAPLYDSRPKPPLAATTAEQPQLEARPQEHVEAYSKEQREDSAAPTVQPQTQVEVTAPATAIDPDTHSVAAAAPAASATPASAQQATPQHEALDLRPQKPDENRNENSAVASAQAEPAHTSVPTSIDAELQASADLLDASLLSGGVESDLEGRIGRDFDSGAQDAIGNEAEQDVHEDAASFAGDSGRDAGHSSGSSDYSSHDIGAPAQYSAPDSRARSFDGTLDLAQETPAAGVQPAPAPNLRAPAGQMTHAADFDLEPHIDGYEVEVIDLEAFDREIREPHLLTRGPESNVRGSGAAPSQGDSDYADAFSLVDLDSAPPPTLSALSLSPGAIAPAASQPERDSSAAQTVRHSSQGSAYEQAPAAHEQQRAGSNPRQLTSTRDDTDRGLADRISSSLITNEDYDGMS